MIDCSYSGSWVKACARYLDEECVLACGHSAKEKGILLKVYASCRANEEAATYCFSVNGATNDKNTGIMSYFVTKKFSDSQHSFGINFTDVRCGKGINEPCTLAPDYTWQRRSEGERVFLVRGKDRGRPAWHYVLLVDDDEMVGEFQDKVKGGTVDVANYGQVLKSGWGEQPPNEVRDEIDRKYSAVYS